MDLAPSVGLESDQLLRLPRIRPAQKLHRYKQRGQQTFFGQFLMVYIRFCSASFDFRHSLRPVFPRVPRLSVADYVVRHRYSTYSGLAQPQSKKTVNVKSVCLNRLQSNINLRRWIAPLSTTRRKFYDTSRKTALCGSLNFYLCLIYCFLLCKI